MRAKVIEGAVEVLSFAEMRKRDHMSAFFRRAMALVAFVVALGRTGRQLDRWLRLQPSLRPDPSARQRVEWRHVGVL